MCVCKCVCVCVSVCACVSLCARAALAAPSFPLLPPPLPLALRDGGVAGVEGGRAPKWGGASPLRSACVCVCVLVCVCVCVFGCPCVWFVCVRLRVILFV